MKFTSGRIINTDVLVALKIRNSNIYNLLNKKNSVVVASLFWNPCLLAARC